MTTNRFDGQTLDQPEGAASVPTSSESQEQPQATEEVVIEHVSAGSEVVSERRAPYLDGDVLVVPIYEEQVVVTKRLILREELRVRRIVRRRQPRDADSPTEPGGRTEADEDADRETGGLVNLVRRALQPDPDPPHHGVLSETGLDQEPLLDG